MTLKNSCLFPGPPESVTAVVMIHAVCSPIHLCVTCEAEDDAPVSWWEMTATTILVKRLNALDCYSNFRTLV